MFSLFFKKKEWLNVMIRFQNPIIFSSIEEKKERKNILAKRSTETDKSKHVQNNNYLQGISFEPHSEYQTISESFFLYWELNINMETPLTSLGRILSN